MNKCDKSWASYLSIEKKQNATGPWLPIGEAPKDGKLVLIASEGGYYYTAYWKDNMWKFANSIPAYSKGFKFFAYINR